jgi:hypothetical protein
MVIIFLGMLDEIGVVEKETVVFAGKGEADETGTGGRGTDVF